MVRIIYSTVVGLVSLHLKSTEFNVNSNHFKPPLKVVDHFQNCAAQNSELVFCSERYYQCNRYNYRCNSRIDLDYSEKDLRCATGPWEPCCYSPSRHLPNVCLFGYRCLCDSSACTCRPPDAVDNRYYCLGKYACNADEYCAYFYDDTNQLRHGCFRKWYTRKGNHYQGCYLNNTCNGNLTCTKISRFYSLCA